MTGESPPGDAPAPLTAAQRHLAELAAEGRRQQADAVAAEEAESRRIERRERREVERLGRANVRAALLESPREPAPPQLAITIGAVLTGTLLLLIAGDGIASGVGLALVVLACGGFWPARFVVGVRQVRAERVWLRSLPFPVRGWFRVLGDTPSEERTVRLRIRFRDAIPEREVLEGILGRIHLPATARLRGGAGATWTVESGPLRTTIIEDVTPTNASALWWMRSVIEESLVPLHEAYPLRAVRFES
ncbi:MAG TPA: hypothetical protein VFS20_17925 [Longimicrobium sp.]|nr:hypothetical protein [Longimicrobium sp.]